MRNKLRNELEIPAEVKHFRVDLAYSSRDAGETNYVSVGLLDVRAVDDIRIHFDFDRNGWVIEQAKYFQWPNKDGVEDEGWTEVAFCEAWQMLVKEQS